MKKILVLHGPNLNYLGFREPHLYGKLSLDELNAELIEEASQGGASLSCFQSNHEGLLIDAIYDAKTHGTDFIVINPAAFTHTSIALRDALIAVQIPFYEVHISNIYSRETFRHHSWFSDIARGVISGFGIRGYHISIQTILKEIS